MKTQCVAALLGLLLLGQSSGKTIPNFAVADFVLGQPDFTTGTAITPRSSFTLNRPEGVAIDPMTRKVFVSDWQNNRILRYPSVASLSNGAGAEAVFGQPRFSTTTSAGGDQGLSGPLGLYFDRLGRLWVADSSNNRVLMYEAASYRETQPFPDRVFGQPDFTTTTALTTAAKMSDPYGVWLDASDTLWVADRGNRRVLRFNSITTKSSGASADGVLGQAGFNTNTAGASASTMSGPSAIAVSPAGSVFVADSSNHRVLRFDNAASLGNGSGATVVLGQASFTANATGLTSTTMNTPHGLGLGSDDTLWVGDHGNNRVLRFTNASTLPIGAAATGILGQPDFLTKTAVITNRGSLSVFGRLFVDTTGNLWVPDTEHSRVLRFPPDVTRPTLAVTSTVPKSTSKKSLIIKGTASDFYGISKVTYKVNNGSTKTATGTTSWQFKAALKPGKNKITINAVDSVGNRSASKLLKVVRE